MDPNPQAYYTFSPVFIWYFTISHVWQSSQIDLWDVKAPMSMKDINTSCKNDYHTEDRFVAMVNFESILKLLPTCSFLGSVFCETFHTPFKSWHLSFWALEFLSMVLAPSMHRAIFHSMYAWLRFLVKVIAVFMNAEIYQELIPKVVDSFRYGNEMDPW